MFYRRGEFLCMDTNLNVVYKAKTIDTVHNANIKTELRNETSGDGTKVLKRILSTPPNLVNIYYTISGNQLFILSALRADNETQYEFSRNSSIDVYNTVNGSYLYSFHLPKYNNELLRQFEIKGNLLIGIYDHYVVTYHLKN